jgi:site-specific recombinase XerD
MPKDGDNSLKTENHKNSIDIIREFKSFLKSYRSASENTINSYTKDVMYFFKVLGLTEHDYNNLNNLKQLNNEHIKTWLIDRKKTNSNRSISRQIISIKSLFIFLDTIYDIRNEVFLGLNGMKFNTNLPKAINHDTIIAIVRNINEIIKYKYTFECERDKLIILLLYST